MAASALFSLSPRVCLSTMQESARSFIPVQFIVRLVIKMWKQWIPLGIFYFQHIDQYILASIIVNHMSANIIKTALGIAKYKPTFRLEMWDHCLII